MTERLTFDSQSHAYRLAGAIVPSVTQVLQVMETFSFGRGGSMGERQADTAMTFQRAREFGSHVHAATDFFDKGVLDEQTLDESLKPYLLGWKNFLRDTGFQVTHSEQQVFHPLLKYAGTLDRRGIWKKTTWCLDIKTGKPPKTVGPQTAAYQVACDGVHPRKRMCVELCGEGLYKIHLCENSTDFSLFTSCLNLWNHFHAIDKTVGRTLSSASG